MTADRSQTTEKGRNPMIAYTPRWRRRLGRFFYGLARRAYPEMCARHDATDKACQSYARELKQAWMALEAKSEEIKRIQREIWKLDHPYGGPAT